MKLTLLLLILSFATFAVEPDVALVIAQIESNTSLKVLSKQCPTEYLGELTEPFQDHQSFCSTEPKSCLMQCLAGDASYCLNLGHYLQSLEVDNYSSEALYSKACELGSASACTNRASGLLKFNGDEALSCSVKVFSLTCESRDPWGCTMYGAFLASGKGVTRNFDKALEVLKIGCTHGIEDPACGTARKIERQIKAARNNRDD